MFIFLTVLLRDNIKSFASSFIQYIRLFSHWKIWDSRNLVKKSDESIEKIRNIQIGTIDLKQSPIIKSDSQPYKNYYFKEKVDKPVEIKIPSDKLFAGSSESEGFEDIGSQIDNIILFNEIDHLDKFDIEKERMLSKLESNDIDRIVDDLIASKMKQETDDL